MVGLSTWIIVMLEAAAVSAATLALFRLRFRFGWAALFAVVGGLQLMPIVALAPQPRVGAATVDGGWLVVTGAFAIAILVVHLRVGTHRSRDLMRGTMAALALSALLGAAWAWQAPGDEQAIRHWAGVRAGVARLVLVFIDSVAVLATWEVLGRLVRAAPVRVVGALALPLAVDALCVTAAIGFTDNWAEQVLAALLGAGVAAVVHGSVGFAYLYFAEDVRWLEAETDRPLLDVLGVMLATQRYGPLRPDRVRDHESGLYDRLFFEDNLAAEVARSETYARTLSLVLIEVGPYRSSARVGRALMGSLRITDLPCRVGPTLYAALMPGADRRAAGLSIGRLRDALGTDLPEVRIGIGVFPSEAVGASDLRAAAEADLAR